MQQKDSKKKWTREAEKTVDKLRGLDVGENWRMSSIFNFYDQEIQILSLWTC